MSNKDTTYTLDKAPDFTPNEIIQPVDYKQIVNRPPWGFFAMDIQSSAWVSWDATFRVLKLIGNNGDLQVSYTQEIITSLWNTTAKITKRQTISSDLDTISVQPWQIMEVYASFNSATQNLQISTTWSFRYLFWTNSTLTTTNQQVSIINFWTSNLNVQFKFA